MTGETYLKPDTIELARELHTAVQDGHVRATGARTIRKEKSDVEPSAGPAQTEEQVKKHPLLANMEGSDPDVSPLIAFADAETKEAYYAELELQMQKRLELQQRLAKEQAPTFNPRPGPH